MEDITYKVSNGTVKVHQDGDAQVYEITRNGKTLEMSFVREQQKKGEWPYSGSPTEKQVKYDVTYDIGVKIGEDKQDFKVSFDVDNIEGKSLNTLKLEITGVEEYIPRENNLQFEEKGIPEIEHRKIYKALSRQNGTVAEIFNKYIRNADEIQPNRTNNLQNSVFNQKLDDFLR